MHESGPQEERGTLGHMEGAHRGPVTGADSVQAPQGPSWQPRSHSARPPSRLRPELTRGGITSWTRTPDSQPWKPLLTLLPTSASCWDPTGQTPGEAQWPRRVCRERGLTGTALSSSHTGPAQGIHAGRWARARASTQTRTPTNTYTHTSMHMHTCTHKHAHTYMHT